MQKHDWQGVLPAITTPFLESFAVDHTRLAKHVTWLADHGCRSVSLTVTTSNASAIRLYERMGFINRRDFAAYVWETK